MAGKNLHDKCIACHGNTRCVYNSVYEVCITEFLLQLGDPATVNVGGAPNYSRSADARVRV